MKNHELLDMIGDVNEDYVQAADSNVVRPRFRWKTLAACAACAALALCAFPVWQGVQSNSALTDETPPASGQAPQLHSYTVVEGGALATYDESAEKIWGEGVLMAPEAADADRGPSADGDSKDEDDLTKDGFYYGSGGDIPVQEAAEWYDALLRAKRLEENPEWYGGAWIAKDRLLAVAIVEGFRTPELEAELREAAGAGAVIQFSTVKYSMEFLYGLMEPAVRALDGMNLCTGMGVDVMANCLGVDIYSDSGTVPDSVLAALAHLDPDGDAIQVRVIAGTLSNYDETAMKGPAPEVTSTPVPGGAREFPAEEPADTEHGQPAQYDILPRQADDLPQAKYDAITGEES